MTGLMAAQAADLFRIGLLVMLLLTTLRNRPITGTVVPLAAGAIFVAAIIPLTGVSTRPEPMATQILAGLVVNAVYLAIGVAVWSMWQTRRR